MTPPDVDMGSVGRVLIIKLSAFGDIIHALPVAAAIKESFPQVEITWAVEEAFAALVAGNPTIDHVLTLPKVRGKQLRSASFHRDYFLRLRDVRMRRFDLTLDIAGADEERGRGRGVGSAASPGVSLGARGRVAV